MIYYLEYIYREKENTAGPKAPSDIYSISKDLGYRSIKIPIEENVRYFNVKILVSLIKIFFKNKKDDVIIYQYPTYGTRIHNKMIDLIKKYKGVHFIAVIHDLESLRMGTGTMSYNEENVKLSDSIFLNKFDNIICHNKVMKEYLIKNDFSEDKLVTLEIFDYLSNQSFNSSKDTGIVIAGNLSRTKSGYLYKLLGNDVSFKINLYGPYFDEEKIPNNIKYFGSLPPDELPGKLEGKFGLVWDGDSVETCSGNTGNYLRYNNPHKTSLYLASGIPVIIWKEAALAKFVEENNVGITVNSLLEIEEALKNISDEEYAVMKKNAVEIGLKLRDGYYYKKAINEAISSVREK